MVEGEVQTPRGRPPSIELAKFVSETSFDELPEEGIRLVERCFVDTLGVALAGSTQGAGQTAAGILDSPVMGAGPATVFGRGVGASATEAAFINATAAHGLDFDDASEGMNGHPSAPMVFPLITIAETMGATGEDVIRAYLLGFETQCYLAAPIGTPHTEGGWHATATFGTFGAAAAAANLLELNELQVRHALNIAASMPAGLKRNFGSMTKPMHAGQAARSGLTAALLAAEGFTATNESLSGEGGFFDMYAGSGSPDVDALPVLGRDWAILEEGIYFKKYPCCYFSHTAIIGTKTIIDEHGITPEDIEAIHVTAAPAVGDALVFDDPDTGLEAKFSMPYIVASAIAYDRLSQEAFEDANIERPEVQALRQRIEFDTDPELPYGSKRATVRITTADGNFERTEEHPPGKPENPLSDAEIREKFMMCVEGIVDHDDAAKACDELMALREQDAVADIVALLAS